MGEASPDGHVDNLKCVFAAACKDGHSLILQFHIRDRTQELRLINRWRFGFVVVRCPFNHLGHRRVLVGQSTADSRIVVTVPCRWQYAANPLIPTSYNARLRYRLRTLLIVLALGPLLIASFWWMVSSSPPDVELHFAGMPQPVERLVFRLDAISSTQPTRVGFLRYRIDVPPSGEVLVNNRVFDRLGRLFVAFPGSTLRQPSRSSIISSPVPDDVLYDVEIEF
jgi:hypothetical protein